MLTGISNSWRLFKASVEVLNQDRELLWFPVLSIIAAVLVGVTFLVPLGLFAVANPEIDESQGLSVTFYAGLFIFYVVQYFVIFFFNTALVGAALERLSGRDPTVKDGLRIAGSRIGAILGYAIIASTIGIVLQAIEERVGAVGRIVAGLLGATWTVASFLVVPVLVTKDVGPLDAVKQSVALLRKSWGENVAGHLGFGIIFFFIYAGLVGLFILIGVPVAGLSDDAETMPAPLLVLTAFGILTLMFVAIVQTALKGIYSAALYRHAAQDEGTTGFSEALLDDAFRKKSDQ